MAEDKVEKINQISKIEIDESSQQETQQQTRVQPNKERFDSALEERKTVPEEVAKPSSLMDAVRDLNYSGNRNNGTISYDTLVAQTQEAVVQIQEIKKVLGTPEIQIKSSAQNLLNNKLTHIDESLKVALSKAGVEAQVEEETKTSTGHFRVNPIDRFFGFLTDGQTQLERLGSELQVMSSRGEKQLSPVDMLAVQVKVSQIQQELELFTSLLSKALESVKTVMNIQV